MTIQLPIVLWTFICFLLMMLVLDKLLFKPVLQLLDSRKEKIAAANKKKELEQQLIEEHNEKVALAKKQAELKKENYIRNELEAIRLQNKNDIENAKAARLESAALYKDSTEKEKQAVIDYFNENKDEITKAFADRIISRQ